PAAPAIRMSIPSVEAVCGLVTPWYTAGSVGLVPGATTVPFGCTVQVRNGSPPGRPESGGAEYPPPPPPPPPLGNGWLRDRRSASASWPSIWAVRLRSTIATTATDTTR